MKSTIVLLGLVVSAKAANQQCIAETEALQSNTAVLDAYEEVHFDKTSRDLEAATELQVFDYFASSEGQAKYEVTCEAQGGVYHLLKFNATCVEKDDVTQETLVRDALEVSSFPRCYGSSCSVSDAEFLFQEFTLRPTEVLNKKHSKFYTTCAGALLDDRGEFTGSHPEADITADETSSGEHDEPSEEPTPSGENDAPNKEPPLDGCDAELVSIEENTKLLGAYMMMNPSVNRQSVSPRVSESVDTRVAISVTYDSNDKYQSACEDNGYVFVEAGPFALDCDSEKTSLKFTVSAFPRCLGKSCNLDDHKRDAEAMQEFAFAQGGSDWNMESFQCHEAVFVEGDCEEQTKVLGVTTDIITAFNAIDPEVTHHAEAPSLRDPMDTRVSIKIDYNTSSTHTFQDACENHGFLFLQTEGLSMTCHSVKKATELEFQVPFFPKCVPISCRADESQTMYAFDTLKERAFLHGGNWEQADFECEEPGYYQTGTDWHFYLLASISMCLSTTSICCFVRKWARKRRHSKVTTISSDECSVWNDVDMDSIAWD